ncbi:MAG: GNAT family N-acetyltransferase [Candidatus Promineifilaceae bacterium]|nr:GNAT family N-acetyltransferase [Candidatus Promineifilaceae bacterium]
MALRRLALETDRTAFPWDPAEDPNSNIDVVRERLTTASPTDGPVIVGAFERDLIGAVGLIRVSGNAVWIWEMYVRPGWRRRGIGRRMMGEILEVVFSLPTVTKVVLSVAQSQKAAICVYKAAGFRTSEEVQETVEMVLESSRDGLGAQALPAEASA